MDLTSTVEIKKYKSNTTEQASDLIIVEKSLNIFINNQHYVTLMCSPSLIEELAIGFLFTENIISSIDDIKSIEVKNDEMIFINLHKEISRTFGKSRVLVSGCARGSIHINLLNEKNLKRINSDYSIDADKLLKLMNEFNSMSTLFRQTGGVHSCAICGENGVEIVSEDIGRHNALDKLIGKCIKDRIIFDNKVVLTSGRISSDILIKTATAGIPILVSHSAPTDLVINMAKNINLTVIGFARSNRMNIYCASERIKNI